MARKRKEEGWNGNYGKDGRIGYSVQRKRDGKEVEWGGEYTEKRRWDKS